MHLRGTWAEPNEVPGSSLSMVLATQDTVVTGAGAYSVEAGPSGTTTVTGTVSGATINLDVTFDNDHVMHFVGRSPGTRSCRGSGIRRRWETRWTSNSTRCSRGRCSIHPSMTSIVTVN